MQSYEMDALTAWLVTERSKILDATEGDNTWMAGYLLGRKLTYNDIIAKVSM